MSPKGTIVCYYDVDLATDMQHLPELIGAIREGAAYFNRITTDAGQRYCSYRGSGDCKSFV